ncbi:efflux RND transporter periplasmic adaptor subunit [Pseudooceanicola nanhaiensis]|uniref:efflux RND transporter periplasmic adaptor subunit n=1 Tax=Pseudooceanicola nanhaiensis TaxID=375761 RepID=UPI001CD3CFEC|nr:efflux RND transporter periplasmic adaptor subunit [Pseudooceanicola nanhaiensis]MCA0919962.1 efflux RND transporter periplasmic adaptor subunit [Pseudooceanicola nanhaiensis]
MTIRSTIIRSLSVAAFSGVVAFPVAAQQGGGQQAVPVTVVTLEGKDVTLTSVLPGRVAASASAEVRPQVNGIVLERLFEEGADVSVGDPLYRIDDASYEASVESANASLAQAQATLKSTETELTRQEELLRRNVSTQQNFDAAQAERDVAAAAVKVAEAQLMSARIDLDRTTIRAQLSGVIGLSSTTQGSLVTSGQSTALTTIRAIDPVNVDVTQSAAELIQWRRQNARVEAGEAEESSAMVTLKLADGTDYDQTGKLSAAEPYVNEQTGVVVLRLSFPNPDGLLLPGMYVQVDMPLGTAHDVVLVPQEGVARNRRGQAVAMVVTADNKVEERTLNVLRDQGAFWVVDQGVSAGDKVIVEGLQKIGVGATVAPQERAAAPAN